MVDTFIEVLGVWAAGVILFILLVLIGLVILGVSSLVDAIESLRK